jgi:peroxiredoxin
VLVAGAACERGANDPAPASPAAAQVPAPTAAPVEPAAARSRSERPLPSFSATTFSGERIAARDLLGKRLVLFFFDASKPESEPMLRVVARLAPLQRDQNFRIVGVASSGSTTDARTAIARHGLDFTILNDASGGLARRFGLGIAAGALFVDSEGYITGAMGGVIEEADDPEAVIEAGLREQLRLPAGGATLLEPVLGEYPRTPDFETGTLDGEPFDSRSLRGRPAILMFFLHTCPHCHHAMAFFKEFLPTLPEASRPALVGVSIMPTASSTSVRSELRSRELDFFPVLIDPDRSIQSRYGVLGGVPDILLLDAEGRVRARSNGWRDERDPPLLRMRLAKLAGQPVPLLLHQSGYSGNEFCGVCHESQAQTWRFTKHAQAFDTLVRHGVERDEECVGCHVVGFGKGGYSVDPPSPHLEDVGCETCHGQGGGHLTGTTAAPLDASSCSGCHDAKHSLGFEYATFLPKVSHAANAGLLALPLAEKQARVAALGESRGALFPDAEYVGSEACQSCHAAEYASWEKQPHGRAVASLEAKGEASNGECLACHTTAYGKPGGFPASGQTAEHPALASVGCESCHGPGGDHVAEGARKSGSIVSLGDKCDSCVILQICGGCHDGANDPGFEFAVQERIDAQRHGTIEPGGKPKTEARTPLLESVAAVERALAGGASPGGR